MATWRFLIRPKPGLPDPTGEQLRALLADFGISATGRVQSGRIFLIELDDGPDEAAAAERIATDLLCNTVIETYSMTREGRPTEEPGDALAVETHFKPGVMDNVAQSTLLALRDMGIQARSVRTARRCEISPMPDDRDISRISKLVGNACIEDVFVGAPKIGPPPRPPEYAFRLVTVPLCELDDAGLERLSREGHLFLSLEEMRAIQNHFRLQQRDPTDLELETLAQTWSEHCVHKTLKSAYLYRGAPFPGDTAPVVAREYENLLRDTIARATHELAAENRGPECLSVFVDNAGVIAFDETHGIAFKVETHNHPSAIEPYGGASTGVGGVIRDVLGCGLGARPVANTDVFCVAPPDWPVDRVPRGVIHPRTTLRGVVAGVRDYGNRMGIPTVNGAVHFDPRYLGNPLVYCGCVGLIRRDRIQKAARPGDAIILVGGRTGRDGIHGATFSSAELTESHGDEFAHAVQIGNAIEEKKVLDLVLLAGGYRAATEAGGDDRCLFTAITDCGAGGLSSAIGEMGAEIGVEVDLEKAPLKYAGLRYDEIWISEAQERMVLSAAPEDVDAILDLAAGEGVEATVIGRFTDTRRLVVRYAGHVVGDMDMTFLHEGAPRGRRLAEWPGPAGDNNSSPHRPVTAPTTASSRAGLVDAAQELHERLSNPTIASKHWIIRQYDHEVQGGSVVKPWCGPGDGPTDAAVIRPRPPSYRGVAIGCGLAPALGDIDPYWMAVAAIDEAVRNVVCVGGDPRQTAILDNFCWPASDDPVALGALVRACQACYDAAKAYGLPFISGKDSLNNVFAMSGQDAAMVLDVIRERRPDLASIVEAEMRRRPNKLSIPFTLLISAISLVEDVRCCIQPMPRFGVGPGADLGAASEAPPPGDEIILHYVGTGTYEWSAALMASSAELHAAMAGLIRSGEIVAAHDVSDGGIAVAVAEMAITQNCGVAYLRAAEGPTADPFTEPASGYVVQARDATALASIASIAGMCVVPVAMLRPPEGANREGEWFTFAEATDAGDGSQSKIWGRSVRGELTLHNLRAAWRAPLDW